MYIYYIYIVMIDHQVQEAELYVCADANAVPGPADGRHILQDGFSTSSSTPFLRHFLTNFDLCLPVTSAVHAGPRHTWDHPDGKSSHLIDFVMLPAGQLSACVHSQLLEHLDLANLTADHTATGIELSWWTTQCRNPVPKPGGHCNFDRNQIDKHNLSTTLCNFQVAAWNIDVETQNEALTTDIHATLQKHCQKDRKRPKKEYVSKVAWDLRRQKLFHRKQLKTTRALLAREATARVFKAWKGADPLGGDQSFAYGTTLRCCPLQTLREFSCHFLGIEETPCERQGKTGAGGFGYH